jgi:hypothetical protein
LGVRWNRQPAHYRCSKNASVAIGTLETQRPNRLRFVLPQHPNVATL